MELKQNGGGYLSRTSKPSAKVVAQLKAKKDAVGVRGLPYPFTNAFAITSDIDGSNRNKFNSYISELVKENGLDFGDSMWLDSHQCKDTPAGRKLFFGGDLELLPTGHGFFTPKMSWHQSLPTHQFDHWKMFEEYHRGNFDHWHSFLVRGPRVILGELNIKTGELLLPKGSSSAKKDLNYFDPRNFFILAIGISLRKVDSTPKEIEISSKGSTCKFYKSDVFENDSGNCVQVYELSDSETAIAAICGASLRIDASEGEFCGQTVLFFNTSTSVILQRLKELKEKFGVVTNLITKHAAWHFYDSESRGELEFPGSFSKVRYEEFPDEFDSYFGSVKLKDIWFDTFADSKSSFSRIFPDVVTDMGIRFLRVIGSDYPQPEQLGEDLDYHPSPEDAVFPAKTRIGGAINYLRTTKSRPTNTKTTAVSFDERTGEILRDLKRLPGTISFFYTHLGNLEATNKIPYPYFSGESLERFRDLHFGLESENKSFRVWFAKASCLADFCFIGKRLSDQIEREIVGEMEKIQISSWEDSELKIKVGSDSREFFGQTFFVKNSRKAEVYLDGNPISELIRNPPDQEGRESVSVAVPGIRHTVFKDVDPKEREVVFCGASGFWKWNVDRDSGCGAQGYLSIQADPVGSEEIKAIVLSNLMLQVEGCQTFSFKVRLRDSNSKFAILLKTDSGGRFAFGDKELIDSLSNLTAFYENRGGRELGSDDWTTHVIPFWDLSWIKKDKNPPCPLPSHIPEEVSILTIGNADFACMEFGRPRTCNSEKLAIGGRLSDGELLRDVEVILSSWFDSDVPGDLATSLLGAQVRIARTDSLGGFVFDKIEPGAYWISRKGSNAKRVVFEAQSSRFDLIV